MRGRRIEKPEYPGQGRGEIVACKASWGGIQAPRRGRATRLRPPSLPRPPPNQRKHGLWKVPRLMETADPTGAARVATLRCPRPPRPPVRSSHRRLQTGSRPPAAPALHRPPSPVRTPPTAPATTSPIHFLRRKTAGGWVNFRTLQWVSFRALPAWLAHRGCDSFPCAMRRGPSLTPTTAIGRPPRPSMARGRSGIYLEVLARYPGCLEVAGVENSAPKGQ
jgi:hypothetical protein